MKGGYSIHTSFKTRPPKLCATNMIFLEDILLLRLSVPWSFLAASRRFNKSFPCSSIPILLLLTWELYPKVRIRQSGNFFGSSACGQKSSASPSPSVDRLRSSTFERALWTVVSGIRVPLLFWGFFLTLSLIFLNRLRFLTCVQVFLGWP